MHEDSDGGGEPDAAATLDGALSDTDADASQGSDASADIDPSDAGDVVCAVCEDCEQAVTLPAVANHVEGNIDYTDVPPAGGDHNPCWLNFGVYEQERPDERWVHNLEHGGVVFLYRCPDGCPAELAELTELVQGKAQVLLMPYAALPTKFGVVSWGYRLLTDCFDREQFATFYTNHVDHAPESIQSGPPSAYCPP